MNKYEQMRNFRQHFFALRFPLFAGTPTSNLNLDLKFQFLPELGTFAWILLILNFRSQYPMWALLNVKKNAFNPFITVVATGYDQHGISRRN